MQTNPPHSNQQEGEEPLYKEEELLLGGGLVVLFFIHGGGAPWVGGIILRARLAGLPLPATVHPSTHSRVTLSSSKPITIDITITSQHHHTHHLHHLQDGCIYTLWKEGQTQVYRFMCFSYGSNFPTCAFGSFWFFLCFELHLPTLYKV